LKIDKRKPGEGGKPTTEKVRKLSMEYLQQQGITVPISNEFDFQKIQFKYKKNPELDKLLGDSSWLKKNPNMGYYHDLTNDLFVDELFKGKKNGYFVEIGALDGISNSTSYFFEKCRNWDGVAVEPNPFWDYYLGGNRKTYSQKAILNRTGKMDFLCKKDPAYSVLKEFEHVSGRENIDYPTAKSISVDVCSLTELLDEFNAPKVIDYISIDVEGSELVILDQFFKDNKYEVKVISVEHTWWDKLLHIMSNTDLMHIENYYQKVLRLDKNGFIIINTDKPTIETDKIKGDGIIHYEHFFINNKYFNIVEK
jgi:FkbM family methyltransferase|tara:strand:+ start:250 stop:1179 length:930 start_codon:yes stop_codon:yes gene_type:complete